MAAAGWLALAAAAAAQPTAIGLSTVRAQRFGNENLFGVFTPQAGDLFARTLVAGDFNGDGADDLATGIAGDNGVAGREIADMGSVVVRYGSPGGGLSTKLAGTFLRQTDYPDPAEAGDTYGYALAACDFNGDLVDDLAIGIPGENHLGRYDAGAVQVHFGTSSGITSTGEDFFTQSSPGIPGDVEEYDHTGHALACGDFDGDGIDDLAVGVPAEDFGSARPDAGMIIVVPGSPTGLDHARARHLDQDVAGMAGNADLLDWFGWSLAVGNFDGDGFADLAIGVPLDEDGGAVHVVFGSATGLTPTRNLLLSETSIGGHSVSGDGFGHALVAGDFDGDGFSDLAIGIPGKEGGPGGSYAATGQVDVIYGAPPGFDLSRAQFWSQDNILGNTTSEPNDNFGYALAEGDFDKDGFDDLAAGIWEFVSGPNDGALLVLMGSASRLTGARRRGIAAGYEGIPGDATQHEKAFASLSLASGDFDADGHADLAIGAPIEDENGLADVGSETVLYGALFADGVETANTAFWSATSVGPGVNSISASTAAKLGPPSSKLGIAVTLGTTIPGNQAFVRVGPEAGFKSERVLRGTFFIDPQSLAMSPNPTFNLFDLMVFTDGLGAGSKTRLRFELNRTDAVGWAIVASHFNDALGTLVTSGSGGFAVPNDPNGHNNRIDFEWEAGNPGHLTMWRTRFVNGAPDATGKVLMFSAALPGQQSAVINHVLVGMVGGQDVSTSGSLYLDELSFRR